MNGYGWSIGKAPEQINYSQRVAWEAMWQSTLLALFLAIPAIQRVVGVPARLSVPIVMVYPVWMFVWGRFLMPRARNPFIFRLYNLGDIVIGTAITVGLPVASSDPTSPLWALVVLFATLNGADYDYPPSKSVLLFHILAPLIGIPVYLASGVATGPAIGAPLFFAACSALGYHHTAMRRVAVGVVKQERDELRRKLAEEQALREKERLARDLHDSVGASLSVAALYAEALAKSPDRETTERLSRAIADVARGGLGELRSLLDALSPDQVDLQTFGVALDGHARRMAMGAAVDAKVSWEGEEDLLLPSALRFEVAKVFQEALHNSLRHAGARRIEARLATGDGALALSFDDDGCGIEPASEAAGRGIKGMRRRVEELGGAFSIGMSGRLGGTRLQAIFPLEGTSPAANG